jgi:hypothetical protein
MVYHPLRSAVPQPSRWARGEPQIAHSRKSQPAAPGIPTSCTVLVWYDKRVSPFSPPAGPGTFVQWASHECETSAQEVGDGESKPALCRLPVARDTGNPEELFTGEDHELICS